MVRAFCMPRFGIASFKHLHPHPMLVAKVRIRIQFSHPMFASNARMECSNFFSQIHLLFNILSKIHFIIFNIKKFNMFTEY